MVWKTNPSKFSLIIFAILLIFLPAVGVAQTTRILMATENWPPFRISDDASPSGFRGIDIEIVMKLSEALDIPVEIQHHPWARALEQMRSGGADIISGIAYTPERETFLHYVPISYCSVRPVFYTQKGKGLLIQKYEDLHGPSVGYSLNSAYFEPFDSDTRIKKTGLSSESQLLKMLTLGRIDIIIGTNPNISYEADRLDFQPLIEPTVYQPVEKTDLYFAVSRKSQAMALAQKIETVFRRFMADGTIDAILKADR
jgi:polar amino acid transport system substrate-binding protein